MKFTIKQKLSLGWIVLAGIALSGCSSATISTNRYANFATSGPSQRKVVIVRSSSGHANSPSAESRYRQDFKEPGIPDKAFLARIDSALIGAMRKGCKDALGISLDTSLRVEGTMDSLTVQLEEDWTAKVAFSKAGMSAENLYFVYTPLVYDRKVDFGVSPDPMQYGKPQAEKRDVGYGAGMTQGSPTPYLEVTLFWGLYDPRSSTAIAGGKITDWSSTYSSSAKSQGLLGGDIVARDDWFKAAAKQGSNICEVLKDLRK